MRTEKYTNIGLTIIAAALIFPCWNQNQEKMLFGAAAQRKVTIAGTERPIAMPSDQKSQAVTTTTRMVIDRFNEAFNRHDADALAALLTDDTVFEDTSPALDGHESREGLQWSHSGGRGSPAMPMQGSRRKTRL